MDTTAEEGTQNNKIIDQQDSNNRTLLNLGDGTSSIIPSSSDGHGQELSIPTMPFNENVAEDDINQQQQQLRKRPQSEEIQSEINGDDGSKRIKLVNENEINDTNAAVATCLPSLSSSVAAIIEENHHANVNDFKPIEENFNSSPPPLLQQQPLPPTPPALLPPPQPSFSAAVPPQNILYDTKSEHFSPQNISSYDTTKPPESLPPIQNISYDSTKIEPIQQQSSNISYNPNDLNFHNPSTSSSSFIEKPIEKVQSMNIHEKLKEMEEISVKPVSKNFSESQISNRWKEGDNNEVSVEIKRKLQLQETEDSKRITNLRKNIREVMDENQLDAETLAAQRQESERLARVQEQQKIIRELQRQMAVERQNNRTQSRVLSLLQGQTSLLKTSSGNSGDRTSSLPTSCSDMYVVKGVASEVTFKGSNFVDLDKINSGNLTPSVSIAPVRRDKKAVVDSDSATGSASDQDKKEVVTIVDSSSDDDCIVLSDDDEDLEDETEDDPHNSGLHVNDAYNIPDEQGRVVINIGHPEGEPDIFVAPQIARVIKPHQIGGVRFLFDNIIESTERFSTSTGFGCILAHSMGLGKTLQVVCFCDIFLRHTNSKNILCIMPINTLQNWMTEFNMWLPDDPNKCSLKAHGEVRPRNFRIFILNDQQKTLSARSKVILEWAREGGVLLIGYELYRLLALKLVNKKKKGRKGAQEKEGKGETEAHKRLMENIHAALVRPGPDLVICDEGHRIKNSHASISVALKQIRSKRRIVLTGYPLQNNLLEYWCMVDFVRPNYLGTRTEFANMFERPIQNGQCIDSTPQDIKLMRYRAHVLHSLLVGFVQRRSHVVLQNSLPQKEEYVILVRMTSFQRQLYDVFMNDVVRIKAVPNPLKAFAVCCKIWNHPDVLYNFLKKREADLDLEIEETENDSTAAAAAVAAAAVAGGAVGGTATAEQPAQKGKKKVATKNPKEVNKDGKKIPAAEVSPNRTKTPPPIVSDSLPSSTSAPATTTLTTTSTPTLTTPSSTLISTPAVTSSPIVTSAPTVTSTPTVTPAEVSTPAAEPIPALSTILGTSLLTSAPSSATAAPIAEANMNVSKNSLPTETTMTPMTISSALSTNDSTSKLVSDLENSQSQFSSSSYDAGYSSYSSYSNDANFFGQYSNLYSQSQYANQSYDPTVYMSHGQNNFWQNSFYDYNCGQDPYAQADPSCASLFPKVTETYDHSKFPAAVGSEKNSSEIVDLDTKEIKTVETNINSLDMQDLKQTTTETTSPSTTTTTATSATESSTSTSTSTSTATTTTAVETTTLETETAPSTTTTTTTETATPTTLTTSTTSSSTSSTTNSTATTPTKAESAEGTLTPTPEKEIVKTPREDGIPYDWAIELMKGYVPDLVETSPKMIIFFRLLEESLALGDRILVFSQSLLTLNLIERFLQRNKVPGFDYNWVKNSTYFRLDGSTTALEREKLINEFNTNPQVHLFLVSTRAGSLGINLVGANRVIVFDASWNPCHDTQAVCRVYRYGQKKPCFVYRLVMDNCLEKKIYDRQVNKQGMSDRVVDECNPDAHLSLKEVTNLCYDNEEDTEMKDFSDCKDKYLDIVMQKIVEMHSSLLSKEPFHHESLLVDRKEKKLSQAEKRLAQRGYEMEKRAAAKPTYMYHPAGTQYRVMRTPDGSLVHRPVASVRPMQADTGDKQQITRPGGIRPTRWIPAEVWQRQGMTAQEMTLPLDVVIPTSSGDKANIVLKAGQKVMVLKSPKGIYMQLESGKIIAIRTSFKMGQGKEKPEDPDVSFSKVEEHIKAHNQKSDVLENFHKVKQGSLFEMKHKQSEQLPEIFKSNSQNTGNKNLHTSTSHSKSFNVQHLIDSKPGTTFRQQSKDSSNNDDVIMIQDNNSDATFNPPAPPPPSRSSNSSHIKNPFNRNNFGYNQNSRHQHFHGNSNSPMANIKPHFHETKPWDQSKNKVPTQTITIDDDIDLPAGSREKSIFKPNLIERKTKMPATKTTSNIHQIHHNNPKQNAPPNLSLTPIKEKHDTKSNNNTTENMRQMQNVKPYNRQLPNQKLPSTAAESRNVNRQKMEPPASPAPPAPPVTPTQPVLPAKPILPAPTPASPITGIKVEPRLKMPNIKNIPAPYPSVYVSQGQQSKLSVSNLQNSKYTHPPVQTSLVSSIPPTASEMKTAEIAQPSERVPSNTNPTTLSQKQKTESNSTKVPPSINIPKSEERKPSKEDSSAPLLSQQNNQTVEKPQTEHMPQQHYPRYDQPNSNAQYGMPPPQSDQMFNYMSSADPSNYSQYSAIYAAPSTHPYNYTQHYTNTQQGFPPYGSYHNLYDPSAYGASASSSVPNYSGHMAPPVPPAVQYPNYPNFSPGPPPPPPTNTNQYNQYYNYASFPPPTNAWQQQQQ